MLFPSLLTVLVFAAASGHKDSVTCTGFSHDGKYVATADMGGLVQVWLTSSGEKVWSFETADIEVNNDNYYTSKGNTGSNSVDSGRFNFSQTTMSYNILVV